MEVLEDLTVTLNKRKHVDTQNTALVLPCTRHFLEDKGTSFLIHRYFEIYAPFQSLIHKLLKQNLNSY